jgi:hypothetical protein
MSPSLPFALDLASPVMLGWLVAAAVPILIHLWSRRRYREMSWAAMQFLLEAIRKNRRRIQLEQWLLLAVRTLLITLIVLAVAEPFFNRGVLTFTGGQRTHRMIVLDGSYSMAYRPTDQTRFEQAKRLAAQIVEQSPQGDGFTLVLLSDPPRVIIGNPVYSPRDFLQELENLKLPHTSADLPRTLAEVEMVLTNVRREHPRLTRHEVCFLTDLCRVGWLPEKGSTAALAELQQQGKRLAASASLVVIDVGQAAAENIAVTGATTNEPFATVARNVEIQAQLRDFGRQSKNRQSVELLVDGRRVAQQNVDLPADGEAAVAFSYRFDTPGDHAIEIRAEGDALEVDNHRWLALTVKQHIPVLCVNGRPSGEAFGGATDYLYYALAPRVDSPDQVLIQPEVAPESALLETDLNRFDCVFLADVAQFTANEARVLDAYVKRGGSLVFFLGPQVLADRYNEQLGDGPGGVGLLPASLGAVVEEPQSRLDPLAYRHPIVQAFRGRERAGLLTTPVEKYVRLSAPKDSTSQVALALGNGDPLIVEAPVHRGRVILVATSADNTWTHMPVWPSYVPIVQELLAYSLSGQLHQQNLEVGQALGSSLSTTAGDVSLVVQGPEERRDPVRIQTEGNSSVWSYLDTNTSGIYTAQFGPPIARTETFAVNVNTEESDLTPLTTDELRDEVWPGVAFAHQTQWDASEQQPVATTSYASPLSKTLLYAVLALLFFETFLAWRFGHQTS